MPPVALSPYRHAPSPIAIAHRGGGLEAPENSWTAFEAAVAAGIGHIETDVRTTRDGVVLVFHDADLDRTTDGTGPVAARTWAELRSVVAGDGRPIPRLDEVLERFPDTVLNIDVKCDDVVDPFLATVRRSRAAERVCVASFSGRRLHRVRRTFGPSLATSASPSEIARVVAAARGLPSRLAGTPAVALQVPETRGRLRIVDRRFVRTAHRLGLAVHCWTVNDDDAMTRLLDLGVDGIITDRPAACLELLLTRTAAGG